MDAVPTSSLPPEADSPRRRRRRTPDLPTSSAPSVRRLSLVLDQNDQIVNVDGMRAATREEWQRAFPAIAQTFGPSDTDAAKVAVSPFLAVSLTQVVSQAEVVVLGRMTGAPPEIVARYAALTDDEQRAIAPALDAVLQKRGGAWLAKWSEELTLVVLLLTITQQKAVLIGREWQAEQQRLHDSLRSGPSVAGDAAA